MNDRSLLGPWVRRFLLEHLVAERNLSRNTQVSYRDTLTLLLPFVSARCGHAIDRMTVEDITPAIVREFLDHLERDRHCSGVTRNLRLSAIHSLARFVGTRSPAHLAWCTEVRSIPPKKTAKMEIAYLEKVEWLLCWSSPTDARRLARATTLCCFSCTTPEPGPMKWRD
jgi:site-specific recombinase XerD